MYQQQEQRTNKDKDKILLFKKLSKIYKETKEDEAPDQRLTIKVPCSLFANLNVNFIPQ
jgi:hypothetical protein